MNEKPEYRGFRCANCQEYLEKAWHHWLNTGKYKSPVHFCDKCEAGFRSLKIIVNKPEKEVNINFGLKFSEKIEKKVREVVSKWELDKAEYKNFSCDDCGEKMIKGYHVWFDMDGSLVETHFCKGCGERIGLKEFE